MPCPIGDRTPSCHGNGLAHDASVGSQRRGSMANRAIIEVQDQFGRWVKVTTTSAFPASVKQALDSALRSNPFGKKSGRARAVHEDTGELLDIR